MIFEPMSLEMEIVFLVLNLRIECQIQLPLFTPKIDKQQVQNNSDTLLIPYKNAKFRKRNEYIPLRIV